jgi:hypothetical protein
MSTAQAATSSSSATLANASHCFRLCQDASVGKTDASSLNLQGANLSYVMQHWPDAEWRNAARQKLDAYIALKQQEQNTRDSKQDNVQDASGYAYETEPYKHQRRAFVMSRDRLHFALFHEQGCGKSKVFIDTMAYLWERKKIDTVVIIAPNGVHRAWLMHHIPTHMPKRINWYGDYYSSKKTKKQLQEIRFMLAKANFLADKRDLNIVTFNVDGFVSEKAQALMNHMLDPRTWWQRDDDCGRESTHQEPQRQAHQVHPERSAQGEVPPHRHRNSRHQRRRELVQPVQVLGLAHPRVRKFLHLPCSLLHHGRFREPRHCGLQEH